MSRLRISRMELVLLLSLSFFTTQQTQAQGLGWQAAKDEAVARGVAWIRVSNSDGELVNWSTSLAGLVVLGQRDAEGSAPPLGYRFSTQQDQALLQEMAKYVVDNVVAANPFIDDIRAMGYAVSFLNQFSLTGGPDDVGATRLVSQSLRDGIASLLSRQNTANGDPACARGGWALQGSDAHDLWYTQVASSALSSGLRNPAIQDVHQSIAEGLELTAELLTATALPTGGWPLRPCTSATLHLTSTSALLHLNGTLNGSSVEIRQRQALNQLAQQFNLSSTTNSNERYHQMLWGLVRMKQTLSEALTSPPYFVWTPLRIPEADGYPDETPSLMYDVHHTLLSQQNEDGTFPCLLNAGFLCERPVHATLFGLLTLQENITGACIDNNTDADGVCADLDNCPQTHNPAQSDEDLDRIGSLCDLCPQLSDPAQLDSDEDGIGDACDPINCIALPTELCNGVDDDCDTAVDEEIENEGSSCAADSGGACAVGKLYCLDGSATCIPNLTPERETCDGLDNDCDNSVDENSATWLESCVTGQAGVCSNGFTACQSGAIECRPLTPSSAEACDSLDNDCDGSIDESNPGGNVPCATDDLGLCSQGITQCISGQTICIRENNAAQELCDGLDNDCDGASDEDAPESGQDCLLNDQVGACAQGITSCESGIKVCLPVIVPNQNIEICNGIDDDCNGQIDDQVVSPTPGETPEVGDTCQTQCGNGIIECALGELRCNGPAQGFPEFCDGQDNDCDNVIDEDSPGVGGLCLTGDPGVCAQGSTVCTQGVLTCESLLPPETQSDVVETCNGVDEDCDGLIDEEPVGSGITCTTTLPGACARGTNRCINGALSCSSTLDATQEICDGIDNNCNGFVDEEINSVGTECDTGRAGACALGTINCTRIQADGEFSLTCQSRIDATAESCDSIDNDCDGSVDENAIPNNTLCDTGLVGACRLGVLSCLAGQTDCEQINQPETEVCDGSDNDCDGQVDETDNQIGLNCTSELMGVCAAGVSRCIGGSIQCDSTSRPFAEACDGLDNDCDGNTDEGNPGEGAVCPLFDRIGQCSVGRTSCFEGQLTCVVLQESVAERCDGQDNDCDGEIDEGNPDSGQPCSTGRFGQCDLGQQRCLGGGLICESSYTQQDELCDGLDNDCDGIVDEDASSMNTSCDTGEVGACSSGLQVCTTGLYACNPVTPPEGEACNALDDDCDGAVDEGLLNACGRCGLTPVEGCDGVDNDCDGIMDEGTLCTEGFTCSLGICASDCISNECPDPSKTCVDDGCVPRCLAAQCPEGFACSDGDCNDPCLDQVCPAGEVCTAGRCVGDSCYLTGCAQDLRCEQGECIADPCLNEVCPTGQFCRITAAGEAQCVATCATVSCGYSETCEDGACVADPCAGTICPDGITCIDGTCDTNCSGIICPRGQTCRLGQCRHDDCFNIECPDGQRCELVNGSAQCIADWLTEEVSELMDAALPTEDSAMGGSTPDGDFVPSTYDEGVQPPSFMWDAGIDPMQTTETSNGCDCNQPNASPSYAWVLMLLFPAMCRRRRRNN
jgi:hypothetical protein